MSSATIPRYSSSSSLSSSAPRKRHQSLHSPTVVDEYLPLKIPLRWHDPPPKYPPLECPMRWRDPPPDREVRKHPLPDHLFCNQPMTFVRDSPPLINRSAAFSCDPSPLPPAPPEPNESLLHPPPQITSASSVSPPIASTPSASASAHQRLASASERDSAPSDECDSAPGDEADPASGDERDSTPGIWDQTPDHNRSTTSKEKKQNRKELKQEQVEEENDNNSHHPIQLPPPDLAASSDVNIDDEMRFNKPVVISCNKLWREVDTVQNIVNKQITPARSDSSPDFSHHQTCEPDLLPLGSTVSMDDCLGTSESFMIENSVLKNHISYECISDSSSQVSYDGKEKEGFKNVSKNKASLIGMASLHLAEYVFTLGVKIPGLNSTYKADPTQCSQTARRNVTDNQLGRLLPRGFMGNSYGDSLGIQRAYLGALLQQQQQ